MKPADRARANQAWEDAVLFVLFEWTVPDPDVPGLNPEQLLVQIITEAKSALERLKVKGLLDEVPA